MHSDEPKTQGRQKDLADIARLLEARPELCELVPASILERRIR